MAQQGFMGRLRRWFSGPSDTYFFGLQIAIKCFGEDTVRARFAHVLEDERQADENVDEKRQFLRRFLALLDENELFWTYGYWTISMSLKLPPPSLTPGPMKSRGAWRQWRKNWGHR